MNIHGIDTEKRTEWYKLADDWEQDFCRRVAPYFGLSVRINPVKTTDPTAVDLVITDSNGETEAELKPQFSPFFKALDFFDVDPQFAFAFNKTDYEEYKSVKLQNVPIFYWIEWRLTEWQDKNGNTYNVRPMLGLWWSRIGELIKFIQSEEPPLHQYGRRVNDKNNASESFIFDVRNFAQIRFWLYDSWFSKY